MKKKTTGKQVTTRQEKKAHSGSKKAEKALIQELGGPIEQIQKQPKQFMQGDQIMREKTPKCTAMDEALRQNKADYSAMFGLAGVGKATVDPKTGRFTRVNRKLCRMTGYTAKEMLTMTFSDLTHPDDREADLAVYERVLRGETMNWVSEKRYIRKNGHIIWVRISGTLVRDAKSKPLQSVAVIEDVTESRLMKDEIVGWAKFPCREPQPGHTHKS